MIDFIRFRVWPMVKVKTIHLWWAIRYGGKKNIPPELIFGQMEKSMARMRESLEQAFRLMPPDAPEEEKRDILRALELAQQLEEGQKEIKRDAEGRE